MVELRCEGLVRHLLLNDGWLSPIIRLGLHLSVFNRRLFATIHLVSSSCIHSSVSGLASIAVHHGVIVRVDPIIQMALSLLLLKAPLVPLSLAPGLLDTRIICPARTLRRLLQLFDNSTGALSVM